MDYAAQIRPVIDRVFVASRMAARPNVRKMLDETGRRPGLILDIYFGLLARPLPAEGFTAVTTYRGGEMTEQVEQGLMTVDEKGTWQLTDSGRELALTLQRLFGESAQEQWVTKAAATMPRLVDLPRVAELLEKLLKAGAASGGPAFTAVAPVSEPADASPTVQITCRLGALRHHRADAHRAAWAAAGLTVAELRELPLESPQRQAIEAETNRLDAPIYQALTEQERWEFLALLGALPG